MPNGRKKEDHLTVSWDTDSDRESSSSDEEATRDSYERLDNSFAKEVRQKLQAIDADIAQLNLNREELVRWAEENLGERSLDVNDIRPPDFNPRLKIADDKIDQVLNNTKGATKPEKKSTVRRWILINIGLLVASGLGYTIYELLRRKSKGEGDSDIEVPQELKDKLQELVDKWSKASDSAYWEDFANSIDSGLVIKGEQQSFTIADQIIFLNLTIATSPLKELWIWDSAIDAEKNAEEIKKFHDSSKKVSDIYRHVLEVKYKNRAMPRAIAAKQLQIVLGWILDSSQGGA